MKDNEKQRIVLVAGTFDILHESHINMLRNARNLGDKLIVMLSTDEFNATKGKKSYQEYDTRKYVLESVRYVDLVIRNNHGMIKHFILICLMLIYLLWEMIGEVSLIF